MPGAALEFFKQEGALQFFSSNICLKIEKNIIKRGREHARCAGL
jgi:hypothetical protein